MTASLETSNLPSHLREIIRRILKLNYLRKPQIVLIKDDISLSLVKYFNKSNFSWKISFF
ncbi:unnamed protein product [Tenebrio molitor]|nr:unnamed protein product [Tenebrio molitor]